MDIAILGAGVAGLYAAIFLKQLGHRVQLYERSDIQAHTGAGMVLWPNASFVLDQLKMLEVIKTVAGQPTQMQRLSSKGEPLGSIDIGLINRTMGYASYAVLRSDFLKVSLARLNSLGVYVHYNHTVINIKRHSSRTEVQFSNGKVVSADMIIGADGRMASLARKFVTHDARPVYQGFINWVGVFQSDQDIFKKMRILDYWGVGKRFGIVPVSKRKAYWAGGSTSVHIGDNEPSKYRQELIQCFKGWPDIINRIINHKSSNQIHKIYVHDHNPIPVWHRDNLIIIGDAAHAPLPTSGQGACQALEDVWHLTQCLEKHYKHKDLTTVFRKFTKLRTDKTSAIIAGARQFAGALFSDDYAICKARDAASKQTDFQELALNMSHAWGRLLPLSSHKTV